MNYNPVENLKTADYSRKMILEREQKIDDKIARATPSIPQNQPKGTKPNRSNLPTKTKSISGTERQPWTSIMP